MDFLNLAAAVRCTVLFYLKVLRVHVLPYMYGVYTRSAVCYCIMVILVFTGYNSRYTLFTLLGTPYSYRYESYLATYRYQVRTHHACSEERTTVPYIPHHPTSSRPSASGRSHTVVSRTRPQTERSLARRSPRHKHNLYITSGTPHAARHSAGRI